MQHRIYYILLLLLLLKVGISAAQTNIVKVEYYIDNDPGYGLGTNVSISAAANIANQTFAINPSTLNAGIHSLVLRAKDANGNWSLQNSLIFYKPYSVASTAVGNITKVEYYIDSDPGYGLATNVVVGASTNISNLVIPFNPTSLSTGIHSLVIRAKDANGNWSLQNSSVFYKPYAITSSAISSVTKVEYFIDNDPGYGLATNVSITSSTNISNVVIPINPTSLATGIHSFVIRAKDANGNWSLQNVNIFYKPYSITNTAISNITKVEYYIDNDPGLGLATNVTVGASTNISNIIIPINPTSLTTGLHTMVVRAKDANGNWSLQNRTTIYKPYVAPTAATLSNIVKVEYYFDFDPGYGNAVNVPVTAGTNISNVIIPIDPFPLTVCDHNFYVRAKDANGNWSLLNDKPVTVPMTISIKLFLEGYYRTNGNMTNVLTNQGVQSGPCSEVDSVKIVLHNTSSPYTTAYSYKGVLRTDGILPCKFPASVNGNSYYIAVQHRNSVETWSALPVLLSQSATYDFTTANSTSFGNSMVQVDSAVWAIHTGDFNQDENIDLIDMTTEEIDINNFEFGYFATDANGDGNVDLLDVPVVETNVSNFIFSSHPQ